MGGAITGFSRYLTTCGEHVPPCRFTADYELTRSSRRGQTRTTRRNEWILAVSRGARIPARFGRAPVVYPCLSRCFRRRQHHAAGQPRPHPAGIPAAASAARRSLHFADLPRPPVDPLLDGSDRSRRGSWLLPDDQRAARTRHGLPYGSHFRHEPVCARLLDCPLPRNPYARRSFLRLLFFLQRQLAGCEPIPGSRLFDPLRGLGRMPGFSAGFRRQTRCASGGLPQGIAPFRLGAPRMADLEGGQRAERIVFAGHRLKPGAPLPLPLPGLDHGPNVSRRAIRPSLFSSSPP